MKKRLATNRTSRKDAPAAAAPSQPHSIASPTAERQQQLRQEACRRAAAEMKGKIAEALLEHQSEWLAATGGPMPKGVDEIFERAVAIGRSKGLPQASDTIGEYTLADIFEMESQQLRDQEKFADRVVARLSAARPSTRQRHDGRRGRSGAKQKPLTREEQSLLLEYDKRPPGETKPQFIARQPAVAMVRTEVAKTYATVKLTMQIDRLLARLRRRKSRQVKKRA